MKVEFSILGVLGIVFIILKLCDVIQWSWVHVLIPFWMPIVAAIVVRITIAVYCIFKKRKK